MPVPGEGTDCICGAARTVSGLGSSAGYCSSVGMTGFPAPGSTDLSSCSLPPPSAHKGAHCIALSGALDRWCAAWPPHGGQTSLGSKALGDRRTRTCDTLWSWSSSRSTRGGCLVGSYGAWRAVPPDGAEVCTEQFGAVDGVSFGDAWRTARLPF